MLKENKGKLLITALIILSPILAGLILWPRLPDQIATHFGVDGTADGWSSKPFAVFALPLILLAAHLFCMIIMFADPKRQNIGRKPLLLAFWICPVVSLAMNLGLYAYALNVQISIPFICICLIGVLQVVLGNIFPKVQQNYSFGLKLPWTLNDPENWNRTHRLAGWCMVLSGVVVIISALWKSFWIVLAVSILGVAVPCVYSWIYYQRHRKENN